MQCVIMAAGQGMRLRPYTEDRPKPLVAVAGRPIIAHIIDALPAMVDELVVVVKYRGDMLRAFLGNEYADRSVRIVEQRTPDGTGGALLAARGELRERFFVLPADDLHDPTGLLRLAQVPLGLLAVRSEHPERFGVLSLAQDGSLASIEEKPDVPPTNLVSTSAMVLDTRVFNYIPPHRDELRLTDMVTGLACDTPVGVVEHTGWCSIGYPEDIGVAERWLSDRGR